MKKSIMPYVLKGISSDTLRTSKHMLHRLKRQLHGESPVVEVFLKADDPYSYLLVQALAKVRSRFKVSLKFHVFQDIDPDMYPRLDMLNRYAQYDAGHLAELYDLRFPRDGQLIDLNQKRVQCLAMQLVKIENDPNFLSKAGGLMQDFWFNQPVTESEPVDEKTLKMRLDRNHALLREKGHYLGAMMFFEGEWYWGIDRLDHLEKRLIDEGFAKTANERIEFNRTYIDFCTTPQQRNERDHQQAMTLYWSARSPYSYLGLEQAVKLSDHYQIPLEIKPVLPMVMRGMSVPDTKKLYIFLDTKREASKLGLPYGFVADPLGAAVERCYALVAFAKDQGKLSEFLLSFARGVNAEGIRAETDRGMRNIVTRCGLDWHKAKTLLNDQSWRTWAQSNLDDMFEKGCWGVPTVCYGDTYFWGQDRFGLLEKTIQKSIQTESNQVSTLNNNCEEVNA